MANKESKSIFNEHGLIPSNSVKFQTLVDRRALEKFISFDVGRFSSPIRTVSAHTIDITYVGLGNMSLALRRTISCGRTISVPGEIIGVVVDSIRTAIPGNVSGATTIVSGRPENARPL